MQGVYTALITPFADGALDLPTLRHLVERQVKGGIAGLVPCGTTGESPTLDDSEWETVVVTTQEAANGRVPIVAGCGTNDTRSSVAKAKRLKALGVDAGLLVLPYYNKPNPPGLLAHVAAVADTGLPLVLYHVPGRTAQFLKAEELARLCATPGVVGLKEATGDVAFGLRVMELTPVPVLSGDDFTYAALTAFGGAGVISVVSNLAPELSVALDDAARAGNMGLARELLRRLQPVVRMLFANTSPTPCKAAMAHMGLCRNELRLPLAPITLEDTSLLAGLR